MADEVIDVSSKLSLERTMDSTTTLDTTGSTAGFEHDVTATTTTSCRAPLPGYTYKIVSATCGRQLMVLNGQVVLADPDELGSPHWACEQHGTWLAFRNTGTGKVLGHDSGNPGMIRCEVQNNQHWEQMLAIPHTRTRGAFSILAEYWFGQRAVGLCEVEGAARLCRIQDVHDPGIAWIFSEA